ncbi:MAG TPA: nicotinamide riboside transporter PnuC [Pyrinomonadaceae bacterium]|nr:nicotinamide riboside transporter PnuC [Pyrinomonadaceae bacterium]
MSNLFSVNNIVFTVFGYPLSYIELIGTIFYLWSVWLIAKRRIWTWPVGIVSVILYMMLFYQIRLYSDALEQVYYLGASIYGWWSWSHSPKEDGTILNVSFSSAMWLVVWVLLSAVVGIALGGFMSGAHERFPAIFPEAASYPYLDALTTIMSFTAMWLMARRRIESWIYWIIVDVIGIGLYYAKAVKFVALLYVILLFLAVKGLLSWLKIREPSVSFRG